ncbi:DNA polymerase III, alpha subunit [Alicyclobacillus hesperidum URH17-3-68]|uniref:DNA polymerase III subunit alpha n=1 Tax=Alicyclobacillus hesperidum TaxID=89784 RepID=UPI000281C1BC|nr:DNA polymerase III subunit alpha [Alicyclobacillus hesperidum]EJY55266.1 DNA polymerase III, alpha subunit [Alicyclobacillus hesperidum URH17-3-68]
MVFIHLHCHSPYSFLSGASSIESLVAQAALYRMPALALTDHNTIAGLPEFHRWAGIYGIKPISGAELTMEDGSHLTVLVETRQGFRHLCELLTIMHAQEGGRTQPRLAEADLFRLSEGLIVLSGCRHGQLQQALSKQEYARARHWVERYREIFRDRLYLELVADGYPGYASRMRLLSELSSCTGVPLVATSDVHAANKQLFPVYDVLRCMALGCDVYTPHPGRPLNRMGWLHDADEAILRFAGFPEAIARTIEIADRCTAVFPIDKTLFPTYRTEDGRGGYPFLEQLVFAGARERYGCLDGTTTARLQHELDIIRELGYVDYFLVVWDIVRFARSRGIRCAGRGSAADSAVAYCLYITDVDAVGRGLLFERFMSLERAERPDIDIDFASDRRDEVIDYVYHKYGRERVARVATYQTFRGRSAVREIGAALALPEDLLDALAKRVPWSTHADQLEDALGRVPELRMFQEYRERLSWLFAIARHIAGFPRHFGMHSGGIAISSSPLFEVTSLQPSASGHWITPYDKRMLEDVGLVKLDLLSLRTMSAIEGAIRESSKFGRIDYDAIPLEDEATFSMIQRGDTIGVFQLESPAQRALQARLGATGLEDIVASVALIRPGPILGNMVDPFIARRQGREPVTYLHPKLEPILGKTYGVVLFQEQVIEIATAIAGFTPGEADELRRVMSHARNYTEMKKIGELFMEKALQNGIAESVAATIFSYIQSYASYGFCEAHAAAFATTAYKTAYLVQHYPALFYASILNQLPMGYYPVHVICAEAKRRGIRILPIDINESTWDCTVPSESEIRLGMRLISRFPETVATAVNEERTRGGPFRSAVDLILRVPQADRLHIEHLVRVGALDRVEEADRNELIWQLPQWFAQRQSGSLPLIHSSAHPAKQPRTAMRPASLAQRLADEYALVGVGMSGHWLDLYRCDLQQLHYNTIAEALSMPDGERVTVAGLAIRPHRPPTKSGRTVVFFTLEDETGMLDATMFESVYRTEGAVVFTPYGRLLGASGVMQRRGGARGQLLVDHIWGLS